jgi:shikimate dehydrogenase
LLVKKNPINMSVKKYGLIGFPLGHSFSKKYFTNKFKEEGILNSEYNNYPIERIDELMELIEKEKDLVGLNVTIPYKEKVFEFLDEIDTDAGEIGAVNTIKITRNNNRIHLKGFNTDVYGFEKPLKDVLSKHHKKALILGTGGAAKAAAWVLNNLKIHYTYVSRNPRSEEELSYAQLNDELIENSQIIINTSPIGMYPKVELYPDIPYAAISEQHILYDLIYNPETTKFLELGKQNNATIINGLPMLHMQAEKAWEIWGDD